MSWILKLSLKTMSVSHCQRHINCIVFFLYVFTVKQLFYVHFSMCFNVLETLYFYIFVNRCLSRYFIVEKKKLYIVHMEFLFF